MDLHRFAQLADAAARPDIDDEARSALLRHALGLWRGEPLAGLTGSWVRRLRDAWRDRRLDATMRWAEAELRLGRGAAVVAALPEFVAEHPLVEPLHALLIDALHASGRSAEALHHYAATRRRLVQELGTEPGTRLRAAHRSVLGGRLVRRGTLSGTW